MPAEPEAVVRGGAKVWVLLVDRFGSWLLKRLKIFFLYVGMHGEYIIDCRTTAVIYKKVSVTAFGVACFEVC